MLNVSKRSKCILIVLFLVVGISTFVFYSLYVKETPQNWSMEGVREYQGQKTPNIYVLSSEHYPCEMEYLIRAIDRWYALKERKQVNSQALRDEFIPRVNEIDTPEAFFEVSVELFSRLDNPHTQMLVPTYGLPIKAELIANNPVVTTIQEKHLLEKMPGKLPEPGEIIEKIDGIAAGEWLERRSLYISSANAHWEQHGAAEQIFVRYVFEEKIRRYTFRDKEGYLYETELSLVLPAGDVRKALELKNVVTRVYNDIGYLAVNSLSQNTVEAFDHALKKLKDKGGLILDLRQCGGGDSRQADEIFRRFIQSDQHVWTGVKGGDRVAKPYDDLNYKGALAVLIGPHTFSAGEGLAYDLYDADRGLFAGSPTRGCAGGGPRTFITDGGFMFRFPTRGTDYSASGMIMEGEGLTPHLEIEQTWEDYQTGRDTVLNLALSKLQSD